MAARLLPENERIRLTSNNQFIWDDINKLIIIDARDCNPNTVTECWRDGARGLEDVSVSTIDNKIEEELLIEDTILDTSTIVRILDWIEEYIVTAGHNETIQAVAREAFEGFLIARDLRELYAQLLRLLSEGDSLFIIKKIQQYFSA